MKEKEKQTRQRHNGRSDIKNRDENAQMAILEETSWRVVILTHALQTKPPRALEIIQYSSCFRAFTEISLRKYFVISRNLILNIFKTRGEKTAEIGTLFFFHYTSNQPVRIFCLFCIVSTSETPELF